MTDIIPEFQGEYRFLSNFWPSTITLADGITYPTVEHAFQAQKTMHRSDRLLISGLSSPGDAKRAGRKLVLRDDWDRLKLRAMKICLTWKFDPDTHPILADRLAATGDKLLVEGNRWNDTYWGVCRGRGQNHLGVLLMEVRELVREELS